MSEQDITFSPDSRLLAFGDGTSIEAYDISTGIKALTLESTHPETLPTSVTFSPDGKYIYAALDRNRDIGIWDAESGKLLRMSNLPSVDPNAFTATALQGDHFVRNNTLDDSHWIELWNIKTGVMVKLLTPSGSVEPLRFSPDGRFLTALVDQSDLYVWRVDTGQLVLVTNNMNVGDLAISPDNHTLATADYGKVSLWDVGHYTDAALSADFTPLAPIPTPTPWPTETYPTATPQPTIAASPLAVATLQPGAIDRTNVSMLRQSASFGNGTINQLEWLGDRILVSSSEGVYEYNPQTLNETWRYEVGQIWVDQGRVTSDGRILLAGITTDNRVQVWDSQANSKVAELPGVGPAALSPDGKWLVFADGTNGLETWNLETHQAGSLLKSQGDTLSSIIFSPNGKWVAALQGERSIRIWDLVSGMIVNGVGGPEGVITDMAFNSDGSYILGAAGGSAWIWSMTPGLSPVQIKFYDGVMNGNLTLFANTVTSVAVDPHNSSMAVGTSKHDIWIYDWKTLQPRTRLTGNYGTPIKLSFSRDGTRLVSMDQDGTMVIWDLSMGLPLITSHSFVGPVVGLVARRDGDISVWGTNMVWTLTDEAMNLKQGTFISAQKIIGVSPAGDLVAGYNPFRVSIYNQQSGELKRTFSEEAEDVGVAYQDEGRILRQFYGAVFSQDGEELATLGTGGIWLYNLPAGELITHWEGNNTQTAAFSPDGRWLLASLEEIGFFAEGPNLYDTASTKKIFSFDSLRWFSQVTLSPDKRWVGSVSSGWGNPSSLIIINASTGQPAKQLSFEKVNLESLAFNPDASLVAVGQEDGNIVLIDLNSMNILATLGGHKGGVVALSFSQDGKSLISVGGDGIMKSWTVP